jgi:hypothetical protein
MSPLAVVAQTGAIANLAAQKSTTLSTFNQWHVDMNASTQQDDAPSRLNQIVFRETATRSSGISRGSGGGPACGLFGPRDDVVATGRSNDALGDGQWMTGQFSEVGSR